MRCTNCEYPLWNLTARTCPECGAAFSPARFEFVPGRVRFGCPHCGHGYRGTSPTGHPEPAAFPCAGCGRGITVDEMVLRPADGVPESATLVRVSPWFDQGGSRVGRWLRTVGWSMVSPDTLAHGTPASSPFRDGVLFLLVTLGVSMSVAIVPAGLMLLLALGLGGRAPVYLGVLIAGYFLLGALAFLGCVGAWIASTAGVLVLLRARPAHGLVRTAHAILYSAGPVMVVAIPCIGMYTWWIGAAWWAVSAIIFLAAAQRIAAWRAVVAVLAGPLLAIVIGYGLLLGVLVGIGAGTPPLPGGASWAQPQPRMAATRAAFAREKLMAFARVNRDWPEHAGVLLLDAASADVLVARDDEALGVRTEDLLGMTVEERRRLVGERAESMPAAPLAHRVGGIVFLYHGQTLRLDPGSLAPPEDRLWLLAVCRGDGGGLTVATADGPPEWIPASGVAGALAQQNDARSSLGVEPIPDPRLVREDLPGMGSARCAEAVMRALVEHRERTGDWPRDPLELVASGVLPAWALGPGARIDRGALSHAGAPEGLAGGASRVTVRRDGVVRLGDVVFVYEGVEPGASLWLGVVHDPGPARRWSAAFTGDGRIEQIRTGPGDPLGAALDAQNAARARAGLPPIPPLDTVMPLDAATSPGPTSPPGG